MAVKDCVNVLKVFITRKPSYKYVCVIEEEYMMALFTAVKNYRQAKFNPRNGLNILMTQGLRDDIECP